MADVTHARATGVGSGIFGAFDARYLYLCQLPKPFAQSPYRNRDHPARRWERHIYTGLYIVDSANNVIKLLQDWSHTLVTVAGNRMAGYVDGSISQAEFHAPTVIGSVSVGE